MDVPACPVCGNQASRSIETHDQWDIRACSACELQFSVGGSIRADEYELAYSGASGAQDFMAGIFQGGLSWARQAGTVPSTEWPRMLRADEQLALRRVQGLVAPGAEILDYGCGWGWFLRVLRSLGYDARGVDVSATLVQMLRDEGLPAAVLSTDPESPIPGADSPAVVTAFEVLEHVPDPVGLLASLRRRFPAATVIVSVPDIDRWPLRFTVRDPGDYPPNHLTRWSAGALTTCFQRAGFRDVETIRMKPEAHDFATMPLRQFVRRQAPSGAPAVVPDWDLATEVSRRRRKERYARPVAALLGAAGMSGVDLLAIGRPASPLG
jgi:hypothetical protein